MMKHHQLRSVVVAVGIATASTMMLAQAPAAKTDAARTQELQALTAVVRGDMRAQKTALINQTMHFNDAEMKAFWPVYREYETKLTALNEERLQLLARFTGAAETLGDRELDTIAAKALELESKRTALKQDYYRKLKAAVPVKTAVKALAIEQQIALEVISAARAAAALRASSS